MCRERKKGGEESDWESDLVHAKRAVTLSVSHSTPSVCVSDSEGEMAG